MRNLRVRSVWHILGHMKKFQKSLTTYIFSVVCVVIVAVTSLFSATAANAVGNLDQQFTSGGSYSSYGALSSTILRGQSFTAGSNGLLDRITIDMRKTGNPGVINGSLYLASNGVPSGSPLAVTTVNETDVSSSSVTSVIFDFSSPATVTAGTSYVFVLAAPNAVSGGMMSPPKFYSIYIGPAAPTGMLEVWSTDAGSTWSVGGWSFFAASYITPVVQSSPSSSSSSSPSPSSSSTSTPSPSVTANSSLADTGIHGYENALILGSGVIFVILGSVGLNLSRGRRLLKK